MIQHCTLECVQGELRCPEESGGLLVSCEDVLLSQAAFITCRGNSEALLLQCM